MRGLLVVTCLVSLCALSANQRQKGKTPDVTVVEAKAHRVEEKVTVDGKVKVTAERPLHGLVLAFDFLDHDNAVLTTEKAQLSEDVLPPGEVPTFHAATLNPPGSIKFKVRAYDGSDRELRIAGAGPFIIE